MTMRRRRITEHRQNFHAMSATGRIGGIRVVTFYRFVALPDCKALASELRRRAESEGLLGTVILAEEGVNATLAGSPEAVERWLLQLTEDPRFVDLQVRSSAADEMPFYRLKVKVREEIVTLGQPDSNPRRRTGQHVAPGDWDRLLEDPEVLVIDARNHFEVEAGTFVGAVDPGTTSFSEFPGYVRRHLDPATHPRVAMFCTGGIRCEKASAWMLENGFEEVYQLAGGILAYLEQIPQERGLWNGSCFVFDQRVAVGYGLRHGELGICHGCRQPLTAEDMAQPDYEAGVSCPYCAARLSEARRVALRERHRQVLLAAARGQKHIGKRQGSEDEHE